MLGLCADLSHGRPLPTHSSRSDLADDSTILFGKTPLRQSSLKLVSPRVRQSIIDLQLVQLVHSAASALAGVSGSRFLRSQNSASSSQVASMLSVRQPTHGALVRCFTAAIARTRLILITTLREF